MEKFEELEPIEEINGEDVEGADELPPSEEIFEGEALDENHELATFEAAEIEVHEVIENDRLLSIIESILFGSDRPVSVEVIKTVFKGTNIKTKDIRAALDELAAKFLAADRGVMLEEISGGFQIRTKIENSEFMKRHVKGRAFRLSGPALEVLSIVAYKQPAIKAQVDEIRGVESGHLMRALMDRSLIRFAGKSDLPGKPMFYETTRKFLEIFGLRNIRELPSLGEIDELIPEGIGDEVEEKRSLSDLTPELSVNSSALTYSDGEDELLKISAQLSAIDTSSEFFEQEKNRQKRKREEERAQDIREAVMVGQDVPSKDLKWLKRYELDLKEESEGRVVLDATAAQELVTDAANEVETALELASEQELSDDEIILRAESDIEEKALEDT